MQIRSLALAVALLAALVTPVSAQIKERVFKVGTGLSDDHPQVKSLKYFAEQLAAKSGGKLTVREFPASTLGNELQQQSALQGGKYAAKDIKAGRNAFKGKIVPKDKAPRDVENTPSMVSIITMTSMLSARLSLFASTNSATGTVPEFTISICPFIPDAHIVFL